MDKIVIYKVV